MAPGELLDQRRLLDRLPGAIRTAGQTGQQRLVDRALPGVDPDQVLADALQRLATPVAVDQDPAALLARLGHGHDRHELALSLDGSFQAPEPGGIVQAQRREARNQGVQVKVQDVLHGPYATFPSRPLPIESSLCNHPRNAPKPRKVHAFPPRTRPSLQPPRPPPEQAGKSLNEGAVCEPYASMFAIGGGDGPVVAERWRRFLVRCRSRLRAAYSGWVWR